MFSFNTASQLSYVPDKDCTLVGTIDGGGQFIVSEDPSITQANTLAPTSLVEGVNKKFVVFHNLNTSNKLNIPIQGGSRIFVAIGTADPPVNHILLFED